MCAIPGEFASGHLDDTFPIEESRRENAMTTERGVRLLAGSLILGSLALSRWSSRRWLLLTAFVGANLFQSALTGMCPAESVLRSLALKSSESGSSSLG
jgi:hypothetical protein